MSGLNDAAKAWLVANNGPDRLGTELARLYTRVAVDEDLVVGVGALDGTEIKRLYVAASHQRRGIGSAMLIQLEEQARRLGVPSLFVLASPSSQHFYERHAYHGVREEKSVQGEAEFVHVRMEKRFA